MKTWRKSVALALALVMMAALTAVPAAAESVIPFEAENVVAKPVTGNKLIRNGTRPIRPSISARYISAASTWFGPMPSPIM